MLDVMIKRSSLKRNSEVVYSQLVKELEESIRRGELAPGEQIPPENLLAEQFGISRSSVRVGLNLLENRGIVVKRAGKGTFVRNHVEEKAPEKNAIRTIGINILMQDDNKENWYDSKIMASVLPVCNERNLRLSVVGGKDFGLLGRDFVDALLLLCYNGSREELLMLQSAGIETILFNRIFAHEKIAYVSVNYRYESEKAVRFVRGLGHDRIGVIAVPAEGSASTGLRESGYLDAMELHEFDPELTCCVKPGCSDAYYADRIESFLKEKRRNFTALFIPNGSLAVPTFLACMRLGIRVPDDLELLCFDDIAYLYQTYRIPFHYIKMPLHEMAADAVNYLSAKMTDPAVPVLKRLYQVEILKKEEEGEE